MYSRYMSIAFLTNGLGAFGLRILAGAGAGGTYYLQYLSLWYLAGSLAALYPCFRNPEFPNGSELAITAGMAICSVCGQLGMVEALARHLPGFVVFPVATGGGLLLVLVTGILFFSERPSVQGYIGIGLGTVALILLALP